MHPARWNEKRISCRQLEYVFIDMQHSSAFEYEMNELVRAEFRPVAVSGSAFFVTRTVKG